MPFSMLQDYIAIDNINKYDFVEVVEVDPEEEFDRLLSFK